MFEDDAKNAFPLGCRVGYAGERILLRCLWQAPVVAVGVFARDDGKMRHLVALKFENGHVVVLGEYETFSDAYGAVNGSAFNPEHIVEGGDQ